MLLSQWPGPQPVEAPPKMTIPAGPRPSLLARTVNKLFESPIIVVLGTCILCVAHQLYSLYLILFGYFDSFVSELRALRTIRTDGEFVDSFLKEVLVLKKIPVHLVLILGPEPPSYRDIVKIISWSLLAGISHISIYDHKNGLDSTELYEAFCKLAKQQLYKIKWGKSFHETVKTLSKNRINGNTWSPAITVHCLNAADGLRKVVDNVKELGEGGVTEIKVPELNHMMRRSLGAPDPECAVICGSCFSFYGCCPWNMRVTQMQLLKSHVNLSSSSFLNLLRAYSGCEQRYGK